MTFRPEITYFDIRGRAEPIRLLLEEVGVEYDDVQIASEQWPARKSRLPFGQLPMFKEGDLEVVQSHAIYRHLARRHGLAGEDEAQRLRCDVAVEAIRDVDEFMGSLLWRPDFEAQRAAGAANSFPASLGTTMRLITRRTENPLSSKSIRVAG